MSKISIIVPIYNVEKYLAECVDSILKQSYPDFELILVDDGSTDSSGSMCEEYSKKDSRIRVLHKENGGLSDARNYGLDSMEGEYVIFIDSDDVVAEDYVKTLNDMIEKNNADLSSVGSSQFYDGDELPVPTTEEAHVIDKKEALKSLLIKQHFGVSACAKMYKKELFDDIRFPKGYLYEDLYTTPYVVQKCAKIVYSDGYQYYYRIRRTSISHRPLTEKDFTVLEGQKKLYNFTLEHYPDLKTEAASRFADDLIMVLFQRLVYQKGYSKEISKLVNEYREIIDLGLEGPYLRKNRKTQLKLAKISPRLFKMAYLLSLKVRRR